MHHYWEWTMDRMYVTAPLHVLYIDQWHIKSFHNKEYIFTNIMNYQLKVFNLIIIKQVYSSHCMYDLHFHTDK